MNGVGNGAIAFAQKDLHDTHTIERHAIAEKHITPVRFSLRTGICVVHISPGRETRTRKHLSYRTFVNKGMSEKQCDPRMY